MPTVEKISIALTKDIAALVRETVKRGEYASTSEVIREALRDWQRKRATQKGLRYLWKTGIESGGEGALDMEAIKREASTSLPVIHI